MGASGEGIRLAAAMNAALLQSQDSIGSDRRISAGASSIRLNSVNGYCTSPSNGRKCPRCGSALVPVGRFRCARAHMQIMPSAQASNCNFKSSSVERDPGSGMTAHQAGQEETMLAAMKFSVILWGMAQLAQICRLAIPGLPRAAEGAQSDRAAQGARRGDRPLVRDPRRQGHARAPDCAPTPTSRSPSRTPRSAPIC